MRCGVTPAPTLFTVGAGVKNVNGDVESDSRDALNVSDDEKRVIVGAKSVVAGEIHVAFNVAKRLA